MGTSFSILQLDSSYNPFPALHEILCALCVVKVLPETTASSRIRQNSSLTRAAGGSPLSLHPS